MTSRPHRPRRSVLYVPATNAKALAKIASLDCDAVIVDLEDAVLPDEKKAARDAAMRFVAERGAGAKETVIRINALSSEWGRDDLKAAREARPDAILLPKVDGPRDILEADRMLDRSETDPSLWLWAMVETPRAMLNLGAIAELGRDNAARLACLVAGTNDLVKETGVLSTPDRRYLTAWLMQMVLAARAGSLDILDGVSNDFRDLDAFGAECGEAANMGFDGKTLIHPAQIEAANRAFSPGSEAILEAEAIRVAFAAPANRGKGVLSLDGRMVERLHLEQAERLLARAGK
ncbi:CoA ester lyase [Aliihoeflea aestuarii]|jgi:citrate lyase subunit beta / citryl-CoA lyase|uniref:HpcH/HpaI aldolase/citrate lyase family protein n=1 Tax=Aliihoeflea aestuarii TaxID=453840 RepID=UPI0020933CAC|nr:CoA ester lyase [Aliihoeflea aestuarii]MCO6391225.1 CoA ester lyase [Aliihoeflea aestuarii]